MRAISPMDNKHYRTLQAELAERSAGNEAAGDELLGVEGLLIINNIFADVIVSIQERPSRNWWRH